MPAATCGLLATRGHAQPEAERRRCRRGRGRARNTRIAADAVGGSASPNAPALAPSEDRDRRARPCPGSRQLGRRAATRAEPGWSTCGAALPAAGRSPAAGAGRPTRRRSARTAARSARTGRRRRCHRAPREGRVVAGMLPKITSSTNGTPRETISPRGRRMVSFISVDMSMPKARRCWGVCGKAKVLIATSPRSWSRCVVSSVSARNASSRLAVSVRMSSARRPAWWRASTTARHQVTGAGHDEFVAVALDRADFGHVPEQLVGHRVRRS